MSKKNKKQLVPKLRFPDFKNDWEYKELGPYLESYSERISSTNTDLPVYSSTRDGLKSQKDYYDGREIANEGEYGVVPKGYFVYRHMSDDTIFKFNINDTDGPIAVSKEYPVFSTVNLNSYFLLHKLNGGIDFKRFAEIQRKGGTRTRLYFKTLCSWKTLLPEPSEQQKIADCLTSLDELIAAEAAKLEASKAHKQGLMQKLFPAEGKTLPQRRFPEFRSKGEWESPNGNQLFEPIANKKHNSDLPILAISQEHGAIPRHMIKYHVSVTEKSIESYKVVEIGDFIISLRSFQGGIEYSAYKGICSPAYIVLRKKNDKVQNHFYRFYFKSARFIADLNKNLEGLRDGKMVSYKQFSEINLPFPDPFEQQKIADCLSSIDDLIIAQTQKLNKLKDHKKGLMQQLFPSIDEEEE